MNVDPVLIFFLPTSCGTFLIDADRSAFKISYEQLGAVYRLRNDRSPSFARMYSEPYDAIVAVAQHRIGLPDWDASAETVSDYAGDWQRHADKRFQMQLLDAFLTARPNSCMRELVDYFEQRHYYFLDRMTIDDLMVELITTGQIDKLPNMDMAPAELKSLIRLAEHWFRPLPEDS